MCSDQAAANYSWLVRESGTPEMAASLDALRDALKAINVRWTVAGKHLPFARKFENVN